MWYDAPESISNSWKESANNRVVSPKNKSQIYNLIIKKKKKNTEKNPTFIQTGSKQFRKQTRQQLACYQSKEISNKDQNGVSAY